MYNTNVVTDPAHDHLPGIARFREFFKIYPRNSVFFDRSGAIRTPVRMRSLFPIPQLRPLHATFEELCNARAVEMLRRAEELDVQLYVFWSGGIDSTLVLVSLFKNATTAEKKRIVVLLTEESIAENPSFYANHLRGKIQCDSATLFPYLLGTEHMVTGGEHNDQLFGTDMCAVLMTRYGPDIIHRTFNRDIMLDFYTNATGSNESARFCLSIVERIAAQAPVTLQTHYEYLWWINFAVKWQNVFMRKLMYTSPRNAERLREDYVFKRYDQFFNTEDFQLWSMNNMDKKIKDTWHTYKWVCKDIIFEYTGDREYWLNKDKRGSLSFLVQRQRSYNFLDDAYVLHHSLDPQEWYEPNNDFTDV
jgi:hypothetical protein